VKRRGPSPCDCADLQRPKSGLVSRRRWLEQMAVAAVVVGVERLKASQH
jgi:hypothetical protein